MGYFESLTQFGEIWHLNNIESLSHKHNMFLQLFRSWTSLSRVYSSPCLDLAHILLNLLLSGSCFWCSCVNFSFLMLLIRRNTNYFCILTFFFKLLSSLATCNSFLVEPYDFLRWQSCHLKINIVLLLSFWIY